MIEIYEEILSTYNIDWKQWNGRKEKGQRLVLVNLKTFQRYGADENW